MTTIRSWVACGLVVAMGVAGIAVAKAGCTLGCRYFEVAIEATVINGIARDYCLIFDDAGRGGFVYGVEPSALVNNIFTCELDDCVAYKEFDCHPDLVRIVPYEAGVPPQYEESVGGRSVWRYSCIEGSDQ